MKAFDNFIFVSCLTGILFLAFCGLPQISFAETEKDAKLLEKPEQKEPENKQVENKKEEGVISLCKKLSDSKTYEKDKDFKTVIAGKDGWIYRSDFDLKQDDFQLSEWSLTSFQRLSQAFEKHGTKLTIMMIPTRGIVGYTHLLPPYAEQYDQGKAKAGYLKILDDLRGVGITVADTSTVDTIPGFFLKRDNHWTAEGAKFSAQKMADAIKALPLYQTLRKTNFQTTSEIPSEKKEANDNFLEFIEENCGEMPPHEYIETIYTTSPVSKEGANEQDLLGESAAPEVVLLGTSNSTEPEPSYANFAGFLKESLSLDIKNESIQGGSMRGAIGNYVLTGDYAKSNPKLIIWELSAHYGFDQKATFREIIPAIYGECSDQDAIVSASGELTGISTEIFKDLESKNLFSNSYYLVLALEDKEEREISVDFMHSGRKLDAMNFDDRTLRNFPRNNGVFFAELKQGIDFPLSSVTVNLKKGKGKYRAKICKIPG